MPAEQQASIDSKLSNFWLFWEKNIKRQRLEQKYTTLLSKGCFREFSWTPRKHYDENAENADIVYAMQSYSYDTGFNH